MCYDHKIDKKVILPNTTRKFILKVIWLPWFNNDAIIKSKKSKKKKLLIELAMMRQKRQKYFFSFS